METATGTELTGTNISEESARVTIRTPGPLHFCGFTNIFQPGTTESVANAVMGREFRLHLPDVSVPLSAFRPPPTADDPTEIASVRVDVDIDMIGPEGERRLERLEPMAAAPLRGWAAVGWPEEPEMHYLNIRHGGRWKDSEGRVFTMSGFLRLGRASDIADAVIEHARGTFEATRQARFNLICLAEESDDGDCGSSGFASSQRNISWALYDCDMPWEADQTWTIAYDEGFVRVVHRVNLQQWREPVHDQPAQSIGAMEGEHRGRRWSATDTWSKGRREEIGWLFFTQAPFAARVDPPIEDVHFIEMGQGSTQTENFPALRTFGANFERIREYRLDPAAIDSPFH